MRRYAVLLSFSDKAFDFKIHTTSQRTIFTQPLTISLAIAILVQKSTEEF